jgi:plastocyanin
MSITTTTKSALLAFVAVALVAAGYFTSVPQANALTPLADLQPGDLFRGEAFSAVYYLSVDGTRYVFPNQNTYDSWYGDFNDVNFISDADLTLVQIGGNVTYKPASRMIKINTDPRTYMPAADGTLRHVTTEAVAIAYFGADWNTYIDDLADGFFTNYTIGDPINDASEFDMAAANAAAIGIDNDKGLLAPGEISVGDSGYSPIDVNIAAGQGVKFTNNGNDSHSATADDLTWGTGTLAPGENFIRRFDDPGVYTFFDSYDGSKTGAIYVN